jgi:hypothetical protein
VLLLVTVALVVVVCSGAAGSLLFETTEIDLGVVYRDEPERMVFAFSNQSEDTLHVLDIVPSCDCTTAQVIPDAIAPHSSGKVVAFFDPMGYEGKGRFGEYLQLLTTDPRDPEIMLKFWAEVGVGPEPEPRLLEFGRLCRGDTDTLELSIRPGEAKSFSVLKAYPDTACLLVEPVGGPSAKGQRFRVIAANREGCGRVATFVTFVTSDTLRPQIKVPVSLSLAGKIMLEPDIIAFGPTLPGTYVAQAVKIYSGQGLKFKIARASSSMAQLEPEIRQLSDTAWELRLRVKEGAPPGQVRGEIKLETDCPDEPPMDIKVNGYIRSMRP